MKRNGFFKALLCLALCLTFVSCSRAGDTEKGTDDNTQSESVKEEPVLAELKIAGNELEQYTIVYARSEYYKEGPKVFTTEWDFYRLIALDIKEKIYSLTGVQLEIAQDTKTQESACEILVGPTNRAQSDAYDALDVYTYENKVSGGKLAIGGGYNASYLTGDLKISYAWASTCHAFGYVEEYVKARLDGGVTDIELEEGFSQSGKCELTTVACIGDSITEGFKSSDWNYRSYPAVMQRILWRDHIVINYGARGASMRNDLKKPYTAQAQYSAMVKYADLFDIAFIMLGTNDSNYDASFDSGDVQAFKSDALSLAKTVTEKSPDVKLVLMNCPVYYGSGTSAAPFIRNLQKDLVELYKAEGYDVSFYDMYTYTKNELEKSNYPDAIHPDDEGYALMGGELARLVPTLSENGEQ